MPKPFNTMNLPESPQRSQLFTVRVWLEDLDEGRSEWRGKVQHTLSGEARYFRDWQTLVAFMVEKAAEKRISANSALCGEINPSV